MKVNAIAIGIRAKGITGKEFLIKLHGIKSSIAEEGFGIQQGLVAEKRSGLLTQIEYTRKDIETLILTNPFRVYEEMGVMRHSKYIGVLQLDKAIAKKLTEEDIEEIRLSCKTGLAKYYD